MILPHKTDVRWHQWTIRAIFNNKKHIVEYQAVGRDITERKNMEQALRTSEERMTSFLNAIPIGILIFNPFGDLIFLNEKIKNILDETEKLYSSNIQNGEFLRLEKTGTNKKYPKEDVPLYRALYGKYHYVDDMEIKGEKGSIPIEMWSSPIVSQNGNVEYAITAISEISWRKNKDKELKNLNEKLIQTNKDLKAFAYLVSHDLKEPVRTINWYIGMLEDELPDDIKNKVKNNIDIIKNSNDRVTLLIEDVLTYSRIEVKGKNFSKNNFKTILENVLKVMGMKIHETGAVIEYSKNMPTLFVDNIQIESVFQNLLSNALKFVEKGKKPKVYIDAERRYNKVRKHYEWVFEIKDNGIGIDKEYQKQIFDVFQRLHTKSEYEGTGLGLAICKRIIERHKGKMWVESVYGEGCSFYFTIKEDLAG